MGDIVSTQELQQKTSQGHKTAQILMEAQVNDYCTLFIAVMYESECCSLEGSSERLSTT